MQNGGEKNQRILLNRNEFPIYIVFALNLNKVYS